MKRHLAFSLYPRALPDHGWRRSIEELTKGARWEQFDGVRIFNVALDDCCDPDWQVAQALGHDRYMDCEFVTHDNIPALQETAGFIDMLDKIREVAEPNDIIYRLHSKSCTHSKESASHQWMKAAMATLLDYPRLVECALENAHICGPFRCQLAFLSSGFHFQGSFYAVRAGALFARDWRRIDEHFAGVEAYPGVQFQHEESACLFWDNSDTASLYQPEFHKTNVQPALKHWHTGMQRHGLEPLSKMESIIA